MFTGEIKHYILSEILGVALRRSHYSDPTIWNAFAVDNRLRGCSCKCVLVLVRKGSLFAI